MKNIFYILIACCIMCPSFASAQFAHFTFNGVIEYEKSVNMFAILKPKEDTKNIFQKEYYENYKSNKPQFVNFRSSLTFNTDKSLFKPNEEDNNKNKAGYWGGNITQINEVFTDFNSSRFITHKKVFEEEFLVKDSLRKIDWKITSEVRNIAGYNCRRANAIIMDSIYVVAFYTDQIPVSGGPESFTGLPGMILGVALPHQHITWFATKVSSTLVSDKNLVAPSKGKPIDLKGLKEKILSANSYFSKSLKDFLL